MTWMYRLEKRQLFDLSRYLPAEWSAAFVILRDERGEPWITIEAGTMHILCGYAWNGCSPKAAVFDLVVGTPEGAMHPKTFRPKTWRASLVHDALYQFLHVLPITRAQADRAFLDLLREDEFAPRWIYYAAVRMFGGIARFVREINGGYRGKIEVL